MPLFSIVTPVYETPARVLLSMLDSVTGQTFEDWQLCLVDDGSTSPEVRDILEAARKHDPRIEVEYRESNGGIVAASNQAVAMATGEFIALLDHDDELHPDALALVSEQLLTDPDADFIYTDEDKIDEAGRHSGPFFKPGWSPERFRTQMYTSHLSVLRRSLVVELGGFREEFEGSQDWDLALRVSERARKVVHVPRVLYHWRMLESSTASADSDAKPWAYEAGVRALQAHCDRTNFQAIVERDLEFPGVHHLRPRLEEDPLVSIIIPTAGQRRKVKFENTCLITNCVRSIVTSSSYDNYEIVCVVDQGMPESVREELKSVGGERLKIVDFIGAFNFSEKINLGAAHSEGDHLLFLNDDIEIATDDWLERLLMYSIHDGIGAVGGRLLWEDGRLQHCGVELSDGLPGHPYRGFEGSFPGYANSVLVAKNQLAVTGACLMTERTLFESVGGLSPKFPVNYNDVDYCLKLHCSGRRIAYDPDCVLYHFESSSRSGEVCSEEKEQFLEKWNAYASIDPYGNPNLAQGQPRFTADMIWAARRQMVTRKGFRKAVSILKHRLRQR